MSWFVSEESKFLLRAFEMKVLRRNLVLRENGGKKEMCIGYWRESQRERDHYEDQDVGGWIILRWIF
jgi:hypothetical protein